MTDSDGEEKTGSGKLRGTRNLEVNGDLREIAKKAAWSVSSCKPGNGVLFLCDDNLDTYWHLMRAGDRTIVDCGQSHDVLKIVCAPVLFSES